MGYSFSQNLHHEYLSCDYRRFSQNKSVVILSTLHSKCADVILLLGNRESYLDMQKPHSGKAGFFERKFQFEIRKKLTTSYKTC